MERDFRYLRDKYTDAGAREVFEKICIKLMQCKSNNTYPVEVSQGDGGIDIFVGNFDDCIDVYQCKYFIDGIGNAQQCQIRESFITAVTSNKFRCKNWFLCIPSILNIKEHTWWWGWKRKMEQKYNISITLYDGSFLIKELKEYDLYNTIFDNDTIILLNEILSYLQDKKRCYQEEIYEIDDLSDLDYDDCIFIKKLESANIGDTDMCKKEFFNAEIVKSSIESKGNMEETRMFSQLTSKVHSVWSAQYRLYGNESDGNILLGKTYERIEDLDTTTLQASDEISLIAKKGILHQLSDDCKVGWLKNYIERLEEYKRNGGSGIGSTR